MDSENVCSRSQKMALLKECNDVGELKLHRSFSCANGASHITQLPALFISIVSMGNTGLIKISTVICKNTSHGTWISQ